MSFVLEEIEPDESRKHACDRLATELFRRQGPWCHAEHVELATLSHVDWFNNRRLHSELGDIPPAEFEHNYYARTRSHQQEPTPTRT